MIDKNELNQILAFVSKKSTKDGMEAAVKTN